MTGAELAPRSTSAVVPMIACCLDNVEDRPPEMGNPGCPRTAPVPADRPASPTDSGS